MTRGNRQAGFALLLVMLTVVTAVVLGLSYLSSASIKLSSSNNLVHAAEARYVAESGLQHAAYLLRVNRDALEGSVQSPLGPFYVDEGEGSYVLYAEPHPDEDPQLPSRYIVTAEGTCRGVTKKARALVYRALNPEHDIQQAILVGSGSASLPSSLTVIGNVHLNGSLYNLATIDGDATATESISDPSSRITGAVVPFSQAQAVPDISCLDYQQYYLAGSEYQATTKHTQVFACDDPLANGGAITSGNIAGVVWLTPDEGTEVTLTDNLKFQGTLIVTGDLILDGSGIELTPVGGFPAVVVGGKVLVGEQTQATVNGLVVAGEGIVPTTWTFSAQTEINGGVLCSQGAYDWLLLGAHELNYMPDRCRIYDVTVLDGPVRVELVTWYD